MTKKEKQYRKYDGINYSLLSDLSKSPKLIANPIEKESKGLTIGGALDKYIFEIDDFYNEYFISNITFPTEQMLKLLFHTHLEQLNKGKNYTDFCNSDIQKVLLSYVQKLNIFGTIKKETTLFKKIDESNFLSALKVLFDANGKKVLEKNELEKIKLLTHILKTHAFTCDYFTPANKNIEILFQVPVYWQKNDTKRKGLLDIIVINHKDKTIIPVDLKSLGGNISTFYGSFINYRYYLQSSYYQEGVKTIFLMKYKDYKINNFKFVVISLQNNTPLVYECTDNDILVGQKGGYFHGSNIYVKGYEQLITDFLWHKKEDLWDYPIEIYKNNGAVKLDMFKKTNEI